MRLPHMLCLFLHFSSSKGGERLSYKKINLEKVEFYHNIILW